jgi:hypothetical protein
MFKPYRIDNEGNALFTSRQINEYGYPEDAGWIGKYLVAEEEAEAHPQVATFKTLEEYEITKPRDVHRYCRLSRFKSILKHMMGLGGFSTKKSINFLDEIAHDLPSNILYTPPCLLWNTIRKVLKSSKLAKYYSRIPTIIKNLNLSEYKTINTWTTFHRIIEDFKEMDNVFNIVKQEMDRSYFPSLRFIALKLLDRHGYILPISIPYARTSVKVERLERDFDTFWNKLRELESEALDHFFEF